MNLPYPVRVGLRFFTAGSGNRLVSFISLLAITGLVLGVALLIVVLAVMNGFDREMRTRVLGVVPHLQIYTRAGIADWETLAATLRAQPGVVEAVPVTTVAGMLNFTAGCRRSNSRACCPPCRGRPWAKCSRATHRPC